MSPPLRVYAFSGAWGLPTTGPFALKLLAWMRLSAIPYALVHEDDSRKGPKGKSPWIEDGALRLGDSQLIISHLQATRGIDPDTWLSPEQRAVALAWRLALEEHFHQVYEYELIVRDDGYRHFQGLMGALPAVLRGVVGGYLRSMFRKQLQARGVGRHDAETVGLMGIAVADAWAAFLADRPFALGDRPCSLDAVAYGFLAPMVYGPLRTPTWGHVAEHPVLRGYVGRLREAWFPEECTQAAA